MILIILQVLRLYMELLGTEKSQNLQYVRHLNMTYDIEDIPRLLPAHGFLFFDTEQLKNQMRCKMYWDVAACTEIETRKCLAAGQTSITYELCMIALGDRVGLNTTEFCVNHYGNLPIWTERVHPDNLQYYLRKHLCYFSSGHEYGRDYCNDYYDHAPAWGQEELWSCYAKHNVEFSEEYCSTKFGTDGETYLKCKAQRGTVKDEAYCRFTYTEEAYPEGTDWLPKRIECYEELAITSVSFCRLKNRLSSALGVDSKAVRQTQLRECLEQVSGAPLTKEFCDVSYADQTLDEKYDNCYSLLSLTRDRLYCELKYTLETETKFLCAYCLVSDRTLAGDLAALDLCIESTDHDSELKGIGGDFCG